MKQQNNKKKRNNLELIYVDGGYYAVQDDNGQWLVIKRTQGLKVRSLSHSDNAVH